MLIRKAPGIRYSEVTPRAEYMSRRSLLASAAAGLLLTGSTASAAKLAPASKSPLSTSESSTPLEAVTGYNNYYEFGTNKEDPSRHATNFRTQPWQVTVGGHCSKPGTYDLDSLMKVAPLEER